MSARRRLDDTEEKREKGLNIHGEEGKCQINVWLPLREEPVSHFNCSLAELMFSSSYKHLTVGAASVMKASNNDVGETTEDSRETDGGRRGQLKTEREFWVLWGRDEASVDSCELKWDEEDGGEEDGGEEDEEESR